MGINKVLDRRGPAQAGRVVLKRKDTKMKQLIGLLLILGLASCNPADSQGDYYYTVTTPDQAQVYVSFAEPSGVIRHLKVWSPWRSGTYGPSDNAYVFLSAMREDGVWSSVKVSVYKDGQLWQTDESKGIKALARVHGTL